MAIRIHVPLAQVQVIGLGKSYVMGYEIPAYELGKCKTLWVISGMD